MGIEHRHIEVFRAIMRSGSVTGAANLLYTSQPTISRELSRFESLLGFLLFDRIKGRLQPTAQAVLLYEEIQRSYIGLEHIINTVQGLREFSAGQFSIICLPALAQVLIPAACRRFKGIHPGVSLSITSQESPLLEEWLSAQRYDLGLTERDLAPPGTQLQTLLQADEVCVLPPGHALLHKSVLAPEDFAGQSFISLSPNDPYRIEIDSLFRARNISRVLAAETQSAASACSLAREGIGITIVNPLSALEYAEHGLQWRPLSVSIPFRVSLVRPSFRPSTPLTHNFTAALEAEASAILARLATAARPS